MQSKYIFLIVFWILATASLIAQDCPDGEFRIKGKIESYCGFPVEGAIVELRYVTNNNTVWVSTDKSGCYDLGCFPANQDYSITVSEESNYLDGVSEADNELIRNHILGIDPFTNPFQLIAADVDLSNGVSSLDVVILENLITGQSTTFPNAPSWRFFPTELLEPTNPSTFIEFYSISNLDKDHLNLDWIGVKLGDVDCEENYGILTFLDDACVEQVDVVCSLVDSQAEQVVLEEYQFCIGDTTTISIDREAIDSIFGPNFYTYQVNLTNLGTIINQDDSNYTIVWDKLGNECICLTITTIDWTNDEVLEHHECLAFRVHEYGQLIIEEATGLEDSATICNGETITFEEVSGLSSDLKWYLDNGETYFGNELSLSFDIPGIYQLRVEDASACHCQLPSTFTIEVLPGETPYITCIGAICVVDTATYYSGILCDEYYWETSPNGNIVDGGNVGDAYISVVWSNNDDASLTLSTPGCLEDACSENVTQTIDVVGGIEDITGLEIVCWNDRSVYSIPLIDGVDYQWTVDDYGSIIAGQGSNTISVQWGDNYQPAQTSIHVAYENCALGCSSNSSLDVSILPKVDILGFNNIECQNQLVSLYSSITGLALDWTVTAPDGSTSFYPSVSFIDIVTLQFGTYLVSGHNPANTSCNSQVDISFESLVFDDIDLGYIQGPEPICKNYPSFYELSPANLLYDIHWTFIDGSLPPYELTGREVIMTWTTDGPYEINVHYEDPNTGCAGQTTMLVSVPDIQISSVDTSCIHSTSQYNIENTDGHVVQWQINPSQAGSFINTDNTSAEILWSIAGSHQLDVILCDVVKTVSVEVLPEPAINFNFDPQVCFGEDGTIELLPMLGQSMSVRDQDGLLIQQSSPLTVAPGIYTVEVTNEFGCIDSSHLEIVERQAVELNISSPGHSNSLCNNLAIYEMFSDVTPGVFTYQWFLDGLPIPGATGSSYSSSLEGTYQLVKTDIFGCSSESNVLIFARCTGGGGGTNNLDPVTLDFTNIECHDLTFEVVPPYNSTSFNWDFDDPQSNNNSATGIQVQHEFSKAGYYTVLAYGTDSPEIGVISITIPVVPDFYFEKTCPFDPVYFFDQSSFLPGETGFTYDWDFGDPASGVDNTSSLTNPTHIFSGEGNYTVSYTVSHSSGCSSTISREVNITDYENGQIVSTIVNCVGNSLSFSFSENTDGLEYLWDFGDPTSGVANNSNQVNPYHRFETAGVYDVSLSLTDPLVCTYVINESISIVDNTLTGTIAVSGSIPKCPDELITLSSSSADSYLWSTGETSQDIQIGESGIYTLTITNAEGCQYTPEAIAVTTIPIDELLICGTKIDPNNGTIKHCDSLTICQGEAFFLEVENYPGANFEWFDGTTGTELSYNALSSLPLGVHYIDVTVNLAAQNCIAALEPFKVTILPTPDAPKIENDNTLSCEGSLHRLSVTDPVEGLTYLWSTGDIGQTIETYASDVYFVNAINSSGCRVKSNEIIIHPLPKTPAWAGGCREVCFPVSYCINLQSDYQYTLIHNGVDEESIDNSASEIQFDEPGEYQIEVSSGDGCSNITDILSLAAIPEDQSVQGMVYFDSNCNGIFDAQDYYLEDVPVLLTIGNTTIASQLTDLNGAYQFTSISNSNMTVLIDTTGLDFVVGNSINIPLVFEDCIEAKNIDFPLQPACQISEEFVMLEVCKYEMAFYNAIGYQAGTIDTLSFQTAKGCDSLIIIEVSELPQPTVMYNLTHACSDENNGEIQIETSSEVELWELDGMMISSADIDDINLSMGPHQLIISSAQGCKDTLEFNIETIAEPDIELNTTSSCEFDESGSVSISNIGGTAISTGLEPNQLSDSKLLYDQLPPGMYTMYVEDSLACLYSYPFEILALEQAEISIDIQNSCEDQNLGSLSISLISGQAEFGLNDQTTFTDQLSYSDLPVGNHILYIHNINGCLDSLSFEINSIENPDLEVLIDVECDPILSANATIIGGDPSMSYSLNGLDYQAEPYFENLLEGDYTLFYVAIEDCIFEKPFIVDPMTGIEVELFTKAACVGMENGVLEITPISGVDLVFELDNSGSTFTDLLVSGLNPGEHLLTVQDAQGCLLNLPFTIEEVQEILVDYLVTPSCENDSTGTIEIIGLNPGDEITTADGEAVELSMLEGLPPDIYNFILTSAEGCPFPFYIEILATPLTDVEVTSTPSCLAEWSGSIFLDTAEDDLIVFDNQSYPADYTFEDLADGSYAFLIIHANGCEQEILVSIDQLPPPELIFSSLPTCKGIAEGVLLIESISAETELYIDDVLQDANALEIQGLEAGMHDILLIHNNGCSTNLSFEIDELPFIDIMANTQESCASESTGQIIIESFDSYDSLWLNGELLTSADELTNLAAGQYNLQASIQGACPTNLEIIIEEVLPLVVEWTDPIVDCETPFVMLSADDGSVLDGADFSWNTGSSQASITVSEKGNYAVTVSNACGRETHEWNLDFDFGALDRSIFTPNVFAPLSEQPNHCFKAFLPEDLVIESYFLDIYDRWGNRMFYTYDPEDCWDGRFNGPPVEAGVYVYLVEVTYYECNKLKVIKKASDVTVVY